MTPKFNIDDTVVCKRKGMGVNIFRIVKIFFVNGSIYNPTYYDATNVTYKEEDLELYKPAV